MDPWKEFLGNLDRWLKYTCYLAFVWVALDVLPLLPTSIADRIIEAALSKLGI